MIPYGKHQVDQQDIDAVVDVLENHFLTQGQITPAFEQALADYCQIEYAVAVNSGTSALHIACLALGLTKGDWLWTSPISFVASSNCALYCGAQVDFVDIHPQTRNICVNALAEKLAIAKQQHRLPKIFMAVHYAGNSCDMQAIHALSQKYGFAVIEDACHALGGSYQGRKVGSCQFSDMSVLSFHPVKSITSAEGGAVLTNNPELQQRLQLFAKHGVTSNPELMDLALAGNEGAAPWYYQQVELGYNYRLSDLHSALGLSQLTKLDEMISKRQFLAERYHQKLAHLPLKLPRDGQGSDSAWHIYTVELQQGGRKTIFEELQQKGIGVNVHYIPIHLQPYYQKMGFREGDFPNAEAFYQMALTLPLFPSLTELQQDNVVAALEEVLG